MPGNKKGALCALVQPIPCSTRRVTHIAVSSNPAVISMLLVSGTIVLEPIRNGLFVYLPRELTRLEVTIRGVTESKDVVMLPDFSVRLSVGTRPRKAISAIYDALRCFDYTVVTRVLL